MNKEDKEKMTVALSMHFTEMMVSMFEYQHDIIMDAFFEQEGIDEVPDSIYNDAYDIVMARLDEGTMEQFACDTLGDKS